MQNDQLVAALKAQDDVETEVIESPTAPGEAAQDQIETREVTINPETAEQIEGPIVAEMDSAEIQGPALADVPTKLTETEKAGNDDNATVSPAAEEVLAPATAEPGTTKNEKVEPPSHALVKELNSLRVEYAKLSAQHAELKDRYLRLAAEMQNFRKRVERDFDNRLENTLASLLGELLPVVDDLERFFDAGSENKDYEALADGVNLIYQNMLKILRNRGVVAMQAVGAEFDPLRHEAICHLPVDGKAPNLVVEENSKGYMLFDKVLRPAKVVVSA